MTPEEIKIIASLQAHEGFRLLMEWSEEQERKQMQLLLDIDAYRDPDQVTKLQASILEKKVYRGFLKKCVESGGVDPHAADKKNEQEKRNMIARLKALI